MIDFIGNAQNPMEQAQRAVQFWGEADARRRARWEHREMRDERERDHRYNRIAAEDEAAAMDRNAGLFTDYSAELSGYGPRLGDLESPARLAAGQDSVGATTAAGTPAAAPTQAQGPVPRELQRPTGARAIVDINTLRARAFSPGVSREDARDYNAFARFVAVQRRYNRAEISTEEFNAALRQLTRDSYIPGRGGLQFDPATGQLYRFNPDQNPLSTPAELTAVFGDPASPSATATIPPAQANPNAERSGGLNATGSQATGTGSTIDSIQQQLLQNSGAEADVDYGAPGPEQSPIAGGLPPADAPDVSENYMGISDTSRPMRPTREMQLLASEVNNNLRRARLAARHGRREEAGTFYAAALQGQVAYVTGLRTQQFAAFRSGNFDAGAALMASYLGYEPGQVQFARAPGTPDRFVLQVQGADGGWNTASENSFTFQEATSSLMNLVDAEGAAARSEAAQNVIAAQIRAGADITVAQINARSSLRDNVTAIMIANLNNDARTEWEAGRGQLLQNSETGQTWYEYRYFDRATRRYENRLVEMTEGDVRVADTNGRETRRGTVMRNLTIPGAR